MNEVLKCEKILGTFTTCRVQIRGRCKHCLDHVLFDNISPDGGP